MPLKFNGTEIGSDITFNGASLQNIKLGNNDVWNSRVSIPPLTSSITGSTTNTYAFSCVLNGKIHVFMGKENFVYDETNGWTKFSQCPIDVHHSDAEVNAVVLNGYLYVRTDIIHRYKGDDAKGGNYIDFYRYNPSNDTWSNLGEVLIALDKNKYSTSVDFSIIFKLYCQMFATNNTIYFIIYRYNGSDSYIENDNTYLLGVKIINGNLQVYDSSKDTDFGRVNGKIIAGTASQFGQLYPYQGEIYYARITNLVFSECSLYSDNPCAIYKGLGTQHGRNDEWGVDSSGNWLLQELTPSVLNNKSIFSVGANAKASSKSIIHGKMIKYKNKYYSTDGKCAENKTICKYYFKKDDGTYYINSSSFDIFEYNGEIIFTTTTSDSGNKKFVSYNGETVNTYDKTHVTFYLS